MTSIHGTFRRLLTAALMLGGTLVAVAGDIATFVNLGFSSDAEHFMFAQYGVDADTSRPFADVWVVDVADNDYAAGGTGSFSGTKPVDPGVTGEGALFRLLFDRVELTKRYSIDHLESGRLVYILLDGDQSLKEIAFRDFVAGRSYRVALEQSVSGEGREALSSFHLSLSIENGTSVRNRVVGHPEIRRRGVLSYTIRQILMAPVDDALVFVIERQEANGGGVDVRYMVETVFLN